MNFPKNVEKIKNPIKEILYGIFDFFDILENSLFFRDFFSIVEKNNLGVEKKIDIVEMQKIMLFSKIIFLEHSEHGNHAKKTDPKKIGSHETSP